VADTLSPLAPVLREKIDGLDVRIAALREDAAPIRQQLANIDSQISKLTNERRDHQAKLNELNTKPRVSDHAVIRYLERKHGFTFEDVRKELLTPTVIMAMEAGAESVKVNGGRLKIAGKTVVTYVD
jgi:hypothetical protein